MNGTENNERDEPNEIDEHLGRPLDVDGFLHITSKVRKVLTLRLSFAYSLYPVARERSWRQVRVFLLFVFPPNRSRVLF